MREPICIDKQYSTTRLVRAEKTESVNYPGNKVQTVLFLPEVAGRKGEGGLRANGYFKKSIIDKPLITVITVVFNGEKYLEETIKSVINQTYDNVEYIIVDGGSTDGTLDIIQRYQGRIDYWVSEPDNGISDAFNKGITISSGEIIGIINSDDWYERDALERVVEQINKTNSDIVHGNLQFWDNNQRSELFSANDVYLCRDMTINHPTVFAKRRVYEKIGLFRADFSYAMDYEWLLRAKVNSLSFSYIDECIANMRTAGLSDKNWIQAQYEVMRAKNIHCPKLSNYIFYFFQIIKGKIRKLLDKISFDFIVEIYHKKISTVKKVR